RELHPAPTRRSSDLVCEAMRKISSGCCLRPASVSALPYALWYTILPLRATSATTPGICPSATDCCSMASIRANRSDDMPMALGAAVVSGGVFWVEGVWAWSDSAMATQNKVNRRFISRIISDDFDQ